MTNDLDKIVEQMQRDWGSPIVLLTETEKASKGLRSYKTTRNMHHAGRGPRDSFKMGGLVAFPADSFFQWIREQMQ